MGLIDFDELNENLVQPRERGRESGDSIFSSLHDERQRVFGGWDLPPLVF